MHTAKRSAFDTTHWSLVVAAAGDLSAPARAALSRLCEIYWYPLYVYVRRQGHDADTAQDLTQGFFVRLLDKQNWQDVRRERGRFRSFLLGAMQHFLANERQHRHRLKRGGHLAVLSLDLETAEGRYQLEPPDFTTPETLFDRRWALTVLDRALVRLRREAATLGKTREFDLLKDALVGDLPYGSYTAIGQALGLSDGAVKVAVHRLRRRFQRVLRQEIAQTVAQDADVDDEIRYLVKALTGA